MSLRLQSEWGKSMADSHWPRQREGMGEKPESEKDADSGQTPVSRTPTMTSDEEERAGGGEMVGRPRKSGVRVVRGHKTGSGYRKTTAGWERRTGRWWGRREAAKAVMRE
ncbi:hypothetical protein HPP92_019120 [Vanilla planifolia]|uniref:Uncharacterized protein n=1 Tax=Vanilla planifolia TaxID=51239 RepID=A0A835Q701_VANPL|nr:hypothetical protein HPP92_019120 [Vanilla planifolia]